MVVSGGQEVDIDDESDFLASKVGTETVDLPRTKGGVGARGDGDENYGNWVAGL